MFLPSRELLCLVLGIEVGAYKLLKFENELLVEDKLHVEYITLSIYEIMNKMKEWAISKGYSIYSGYDEYDGFFCCIAIRSNMEDIQEFKEKLEFESVAKACEYIWSK